MARAGTEEWRSAWQRESRLIARVRRSVWRHEMAELERTWAIASAHAAGVSLRKSPLPPGSARRGYMRSSAKRTSTALMQSRSQARWCVPRA